MTRSLYRLRLHDLPFTINIKGVEVRSDERIAALSAEELSTLVRFVKSKSIRRRDGLVELIPRNLDEIPFESAVTIEPVRKETR